MPVVHRTSPLFGPDSESRPLPVKGALWGAGLALLGWGLWRVLERAPAAAERWAGEGLLPRLSQGLSLVSGIVPFSLAEFVVMGVVGGLIWAGVRGGWGMVRARRGLLASNPHEPPAQPRVVHERPTRTFTRGGLRLVRDVGLLVFLFYALWGLQYARPDLPDRLGLPSSGTATADELRTLAAALVVHGNDLRTGIDPSHKALSPISHGELVEALEVAWPRAARHWSLPAEAGWRMGRPKSFWSSGLVRRFGIAGMYFPYTGEALVVAGRPASVAPKDLAHEMAHQRGIAREADANTAAYLVSLESDAPAVRYAGVLFLQRQALRRLIQVDPVGARRLVEARHPAVQADVDAQVAWSREVVDTPASRTATRLNDAMLRSHGIDEGIRNYQGSLWIVLALVREEGLEALLPPFDHLP